MNRTVLINIFIFLMVMSCREELTDPLDPADHDMINLLRGKWELTNSVPETELIHLYFQQKNKVMIVYPNIPDTNSFGYYVKKGYLTFYTLDNPAHRIEYDYYIAEFDTFKLVLYFYYLEQIYKIQTYQRSTWR